MLKRAETYNTADHRTIPLFTYQSANNPNLVALRKTYNLDSIAGDGSQVSRVLNLMYWLHNRIRHDGNLDNPPLRNAQSLLSVCAKEKRTLNCRGLGTVLNECYLAMGFKSRLVTCLPKDSLGTDKDCHVVNTVYIGSLKKWIWVDPTFAGYVKDDRGELLSVEEVRERLIKNQPLELNPDANWNGKPKSKEDYLYTYMAKNLYLLECPANNQYDNETKTPGKSISYVQLLPLDYFKQSADNKSVLKNAKSGVNLFVYATNNPNSFWAAP